MSVRIRVGACSSLVVLQGMLGMLTVTWLLKPLIVTGHLVGGLTTFALLLWLWLSMRAESREVDGYSVLAGNRLVESGRRARLWAGLGLAALALQVGTRGLDQQQLRRGRVPGRAEVPGPVDPGGRLQGRLRVVARTRNQLRRWRARSPGARGHSFHPPRRRAAGRGAAAAGGFFRISRASAPGARWAALAVLAALAAQISIGVFMVLRAFPLELAAAHNAGAALLVAATVLLNRRLRPVADFH